MEQQTSPRTIGNVCPTCGGGWCPDHMLCRQDADAINRMMACPDCDEAGVPL